MRLLHLNTEAGFRGGEQQVLNLIQGLMERFSDVEQGALVRSGGELEERLKATGIRLFPWKKSLFGVLAVRRVIQDFQPHIVHAHAGRAHGLGHGALMLMGKSSRPAFVVTRRVDFQPKTGLLSFGKYSNSFTRYVAISSAIAEILRNAGAPRENVQVIPSGIDPGRFKFSEKARQEWRTAWGCPEDGVVVGTVGAYVDHKDPLNLIHAAALLQKLVSPRALRVVFVGEGEERPRMEALRRELGLEDVVVLTGWQTGVGDLLSAFDVFCIPSKLEGLCTSLLDALAFGLPCVATEAGGIPDVIQHEENGLLVPPQNPEALAKGLHRLMGDKQLQEKFRSAGLRHVAEHFTVEAMVNQYYQLYQSLHKRG
ncbi:MAG: glycosyltransferase [Candidatus Sumerlaeia bacterium]|nr:glycosyltransferase [Candidatus Sumerlaeia bacterium]